MPDRDAFRGNNTLHRWIAVGWVLWLLVVTAASILPNEYKHYSRTSGIAHHAAHLSVFAVAGALPVFAFRLWFLQTTILVFALAVWLEWMQARKFGISLEIWDILTNVLGAASGALAAWWRLRTSRAED
jgi:hypothetical protein